MPTQPSAPEEFPLEFFVEPVSETPSLIEEAAPSLASHLMEKLVLGEVRISDSRCDDVPELDAQALALLIEHNGGQSFDTRPGSTFTASRFMLIGSTLIRGVKDGGAKKISLSAHTYTTPGYAQNAFKDMRSLHEPRIINPEGAARELPLR